MPLAFLMGAPVVEAHVLGSLMGQKLVLTEFIAYGNPASLGDSVSTKTATIAAYALCGFANFASIERPQQGIGSIARERKKGCKISYESYDRWSFSFMVNSNNSRNLIMKVILIGRWRKDKQKF